MRINEMHNTFHILLIYLKIGVNSFPFHIGGKQQQNNNNNIPREITRIVNCISNAYCFVFSTDLNECSSGSHSCGVHSVCENSDPGYSCICDDGYTLNSDRRTCTGNITTLL